MMPMKAVFVFIVFVLVVHKRLDAVKPKYVIIFAEKIRNNEPFDLIAQIDSDNGVESGKLDLKLYGMKYNSDGTTTRKMYTSDSFYLEIDKPRKLQIICTEIKCGDTTYPTIELVTELEIKSSSGLEKFINTTNLVYQEKSVSIFIQTDKAMYKPGQKVNYRVVVVHSNLRPFLHQIDIEIMDPKRNKIIQHHNATTVSNGVISGEFQLSDQPIQGEWIIIAEARNEKVEKVFVVEEYVLPKFEVVITPPKYILLTTGEVGVIPFKEQTVKIEVKYTHGEPVKGSVLLNIKLQNSYLCYTCKDKGSTIKIAELKDGIAYFTISSKEIWNLWDASDKEKNPVYKWSSLKLNFTAEATEEISGVVLKGEAKTNFERKQFQCNFLEVTSNNFKFGLPFTGYWQVTQIDGSPLTENQLKAKNGNGDEKVSVKVSIKWYENYTDPGGRNYERPLGSPQIIYEENLSIDKTGMAVIKFDVPISDKNGRQFFRDITINTHFQDSSCDKYISKFLTEKTKTNIQLTVTNTNGAINSRDELKVTMTCNEIIPGFYMLLVSKGQIVYYNYLSMDGQKAKTFPILISLSMARQLAPSGRIIAYYRTNFEMIADTLDFTVNGMFSNEVKLSFSKDKVQPSDQVEMEIEAYPNSFVGILAVDTSVLLLRSGNDITKEDVLNDIKKYDTSSYNCPYCLFRGKRSIMPWWPISYGGEDTYSVLKNAGLIMITDSLIFKKEVFFMRFPVMEAAPGFPAPAPGGDIDMEGPPGPTSDKGNIDVKVRKTFPETWLFVNKFARSDGRYSLKTTAPDTITSWVATAFAMHDKEGLGISEQAKMTVFKTFFAQLQLPYSVIRGEEFKLSVLVFNYMSTKETVKVHLKVPKDDFSIFTGRSMNSEMNNIWAIKEVQIEANAVGKVNFWIVPKKLGNIPIFVKAQTTNAVDALERPLLVEAEGSPGEYTKSTFFRLPYNDGSGQTETKKISMVLPPESLLVEGSQYISINVIGDIMGNSLNSLESLIRMPYGCGEQNMINFVPNIVAMDYLNATNQVSEQLSSKAISYMNAGYQRELTYQRDDGSFSAFGNRDKAGSLWLTCYVIKSFASASKYIFIDSFPVLKAAKFVISRSMQNGSFTEPEGGKVLHANMQGGTSKGVTLTAYAITALMETEQFLNMDSKTSKMYNDAIVNGLSYMDKIAMKHYDNPYTLAVMSYAYKSAKHFINNFLSTEMLTVWKKLNNLAIEKDGLKYWQLAKEEMKCPTSWCSDYSTAKASDVELAAYVLHIFAMNPDYRNNLDNTLPVLRWLLAQTDSRGAFKSTQDTVVGISALAKFSSTVLSSKQQNIKIKVLYENQVKNLKLIVPNNATVLQQVILPKNITGVDIEANGYGTAIVQLNVAYNLKKVEGTEPMLHSTLKVEYSIKSIRLINCLRYNSDMDSGMIVTELNVLTGYNAYTDGLLEKYGNSGLKRVENQGRKVNLYWDGFRKKEECFEIEIFREEYIVNVQAANIKHYLYYDVQEQTNHMYGPDKVIILENARAEACNDCNIQYYSKLTSGSQVVVVVDEPSSKANDLKFKMTLFIVFVFNIVVKLF